METFVRVQRAIATALFAEPDTIKPETRLLRDLGADSLDLLDVVFELEKEFDIKIPRGEIERQTRGDLKDEEFVEGGKLTPAALARLRVAMPEVPAEEIAPGLMVRDIPKLLSAATFDRIVREQLALQEQAEETEDAVSVGRSDRPAEWEHGAR